MNKNELKRIKIIFSLFIILSNATVYLLASDTDIKSENMDQSRFREDHILFKISANLKVPFDRASPVTLVSSNQKTIIRNVFLISKVENSRMKITEELSSVSEYFVQVHKDQFTKLNSSKFFYVYPNAVKFRISTIERRGNYEINY